MIPIRFQGEIRKLGINKTSLKRIALEYSEDSEKWVGKRLILKPEHRDVAGTDRVVIWVTPVKEDSVKEDLFSVLEKKKPDEDLVEETQEEKDNWEGI